MQLLTAVNQILSMLGEAQVTSVDAQHSTVYKILTAIETHKRLLLEPGWWFNQSVVTMYPGTDSTMEAPIDALYMNDTENNFLLTTRDNMLFNVSDNTEFFTLPVKLFCTFNLAFEDLPICAATVVVCRAGIEVYSNDLGVDPLVQRYQQDAAQSYVELQRLHLRSMKYNSRQSSRFQSIVNALGG